MEMDTQHMTDAMRNAIRDYAIEQCPIIRPAPCLSFAALHDLAGGIVSDEPSEPGMNDAAVVNDGILSFVKGMSKQNRSDVSNLYLHASLVAKTQFPDIDQGEERYGLFCKVMQDTGWLITDTSYRALESSDSSFTMDHVALTVIESAIASAALPISNATRLLGMAQSAVSELKKNQEPLELFRSKTVTPRGGQFSVGTSLQTDEDEVVMVLGSLYFMSSITTTDVLITHWNQSNVKVFYGSTVLRLNATLAELGRDALAKKLGNHVLQSISKYAF